MDHHALSRLLLRIAGVVVIVATLTAVPKSIVTLVVAAGQEANASPLITAIIASLVPLMIGMALVWLPGTVGIAWLTARPQAIARLTRRPVCRQLPCLLLASISSRLRCSTPFSGWRASSSIQQ